MTGAGLDPELDLKHDQNWPLKAEPPHNEATKRVP